MSMGSGDAVCIGVTLVCRTRRRRIVNCRSRPVSRYFSDRSTYRLLLLHRSGLLTAMMSNVPQTEDCVTHCWSPLRVSIARVSSSRFSMPPL